MSANTPTFPIKTYKFEELTQASQQIIERIKKLAVQKSNLEITMNSTKQRAMMSPVRAMRDSTNMTISNQKGKRKSREKSKENLSKVASPLLSVR